MKLQEIINKISYELFKGKKITIEGIFSRKEFYSNTSKEYEVYFGEIDIEYNGQCLDVVEKYHLDNLFYGHHEFETDGELIEYFKETICDGDIQKVWSKSLIYQKK